MHIREMKHGEIEKVRHLRLECYKEYEHLVSKEHWHVLKSTLLSDNDVKKKAKIFITELDGEIVGSVVLFPPSIQAYDWSDSIQDYPELRMLAVDPGARGKGIGKALVKHCLALSKNENNLCIGLHTASFMKKASALYESIGFKHFPDYDWEPMNDGIVVRAFVMDLSEH